MPRTRVEIDLQQALLRALGGDEEAYREFLETSAALLRNWFRRKLFAWPDDTEDLVQETLLALHNHRDTYERSQPVLAWVFGIGRYKLIDLLRARSAREARHVEFDEEVVPPRASDRMELETRRDLARLLDLLPDRHRLPIVHVKIEGLSVRETAAITGMSPAAVKVGVHRGLKALAARIAEER